MVDDSGRLPPEPVGLATAEGALYGRERELDILANLVRGLAEGAGGALVVHGEAGIGKSSLLAVAAGLGGQAGAQVLMATGVQAETRLPFAGLHQLLRPLLPLTERLPPRLRRELLSAFGLADAEPAGLFLIGLAALELVSDAAASTPVLLIADDAQWLDEPSGAVLGFVARRLETEPVALLIAVRDGLASSFDDAGLPGLPLTGLAGPAAAALLEARAPGLDLAHRDRLLSEAAGNPLALVELPKSVRRGYPAGGSPGPLLPLTARLEQAFAAQQSGLPETTRAVLLAAAANDGTALSEVLGAASVLAGTAVTADALLPAIAAGLLETGEAGLRFRHPLIRSAIYQAANVARRRAAHTALAGLLAGRPDRRAWHVAAAALGPDEQVAADLEAAAVRAVNRSAFSVAADAYRRAAQLSDDTFSRTRRLLLAAHTALSSGHLLLGQELLRVAESLDLTADQRTLAAWMRETSGDGAWTGTSQLDALVRLAEQMRTAGETRTALDTLANFALRCYWGNPAPETRAAVIAAAERLGRPETEPALLAILSSADPVRTGEQVNAQLKNITPDRTEPTAMWYSGLAAANTWAWDQALPLLDAAVDELRAQGQLGLLTRALTTQAWAAVHLARLSTAVAAASEASRLAVETGQGHWTGANQLAQAVAASAAGDHAAADALAQQTEALYLASGSTSMLGFVQFARGHGAVLNQRYAVGLTHLRRILDPADPVFHPFVGTWGLADLAEAAVAVGEPALAQVYLEQLESLAAQTGGPLLLALAAYARPLAAEDDHAEPLYQAALGERLASWPDYRARMLLRYGEWLRRQRRAAESRVPLREARASFDTLGFTHLGERARLELRAAGEWSSRREPRPWDDLTAQELQIAQMAADGMSNREIGQQLFISHRTVGAHLYKIFPKLGITSRSQLHAAIA
ncbi:MAG TPA: AAA family ATPase [Trebonia sp.]|nr:AAA family ATPase [Trebonia sp.]